MNKKILAVLGLIFLAAMGGGIYLLASDGEDGSDKPVAETVQADTVPSTSQTVPATPGAYVDYSTSAVASAKGIRLLFFHAPWCPQCRAIDDDIRQKGAPDGTTIIKVDYDSNQSLRQKYGVTIQTTVVRIDDNGNLIKKYVAYDAPSLSSIVKNLL